MPSPFYWQFIAEHKPPQPPDPPEPPQEPDPEITTQERAALLRLSESAARGVTLF